MKKKNSDFFFEHYEKNNIPDIFHKFSYTQENKTLANLNYSEAKNLAIINSVIFIPSYINPTTNTSTFNVKKIYQFFKGYTISLHDFNSIDEYLKYRFKKNSKSILRRLKRLEICFPISYKFYYGDISRTDYDFYMKALKEMLTKRFEQRNDISQSLLNWDHYFQTFFGLINKKQASLFVIKNDSEPICISLSNHVNGKLFSSVSSYNIDYSKFSLGNIEIYKKLEWCFKNNHNTYEFGMGDLNYKREWSNNIYNFEQQIIYPKKSFIAFVKANIEFIKAQIKEGIYKLAYVKYKRWKAKRKKIKPSKLNFEIVSIDESVVIDNFIEIDYSTDSYQFLKKAVNDFLYSNSEYIKNVIVREESKLKKTYFIEGKKNRQKVIVNCRN